MTKKEVAKRVATTIILTLIIFVVLTLAMEWLTWGCPSNPYAQYHSDSPCFNFTFRCQVECDNYDLVFTGITEGCSCHCGGNQWVSSCSGWLYEKEETDVKEKA